MEHLFSHLAQDSAFGPGWPLWMAVGGAVLFALLGIYAALLLFQGHRLPLRLRTFQPATLQGRIVTALILVATLPAVSLALVLAERASHERLQRTASHRVPVLGPFICNQLPAHRRIQAERIERRQARIEMRTLGRAGVPP